MTELEEVFDGIHIPDIFHTEPDDDEIPDDDMGMVLETTVDEDAYLKAHIEGSASVQQKLRDLCREYKDIFSAKVKKEPADVPPLRYDYNKELWRAASN